MILSAAPEYILRRSVVSSMENNVYLVTCLLTGSQVIIDAAAEPETIDELLDSAADDAASPHLEQVITTHRHRDHIGALADLVTSRGAQATAGRDDAAAITAATGIEIGPLDHGDVVTVGRLKLDVIGLRGHTPGSITLVLHRRDGVELLTGDSLFPGGPGRTTTPADFQSLMGDLTERVFEVYPDATAFWPGHGRGSTLGAERPHLDDWRARGW